MPDLRTALETALSKAQPTPTIPAEWDDETTNARELKIRMGNARSTISLLAPPRSGLNRRL